MKKIYACEKCGQVYYTSPPAECLRFNCQSINFKEIGEDDVLDIHDFWDVFVIEPLKKILSLFP